MAAGGAPAIHGDHVKIDNDGPSESTPLLPRDTPDDTVQSQPQRETSAQEALENLQEHGNGKSKAGRRWPSLAALALLCVAIIMIIVFAFISPSMVEQYAQKAVDLEIQNLSIESFTDTGVRARVRGEFHLDAGRVQQKSIRDLGRFYTWVAREAETGPSDLFVTLPEYGNVALGSARVPGIKVDLRDGHRTVIDFVADLTPGDADGVKSIAKDWLDGRLGRLRVLAKAQVPVKSGILSLGKQDLQHEVIISGDRIPSIPQYDIRSLMFRDLEQGMAVDASALVHNDYPIDIVVPPLAFSILVENCKKTDPIIALSEARTQQIHVHPRAQVEVNATGVVHELPDVLLRDCPGTDESPLDAILGKYIHGKDNIVYIRGAASEATPRWLSDLMADFTVPLPFPGRTLGHLIKNFTLADTHFRLPDPWADPNSRQANPRISAKVKALIAIPHEMNFNLSVSQVRADADVFYKDKKFGELDLHKWQVANSKRVNDVQDKTPALEVESMIKDAPLYITDEQIFTRVVQQLLFGDKGVTMHIKATVDVRVATALGELTIRQIPAEGEVPISPISRGNPQRGKPDGLDSVLKPKISDLQVINTTVTSLIISALVNITNPTPYSAFVPYIDIHISKNGSLLGHATVRDISIIPGRNDMLPVVATYDPLTLGGQNATLVGRDLISQYISGYNTSITLQTHAGTIPSLPRLGRAFSKFAVDVPTPHLKAPTNRTPGGGGNNGDEADENSPHFIQDATMHLFTSTATFMLLSPLKHTTLTINSINATALYNDTYGDVSEVGHILYDLPFDVPPVDRYGQGITTPRLPVDWSLGSVGYDAVRNALGGKLKVSAVAHVGLSVGKWQDVIWFQGRGIGAKIRL